MSSFEESGMTTCGRECASSSLEGIDATDARRLASGRAPGGRASDMRLMGETVAARSCSAMD